MNVQSIQSFNSTSRNDVKNYSTQSFGVDPEKLAGTVVKNDETIGKALSECGSKILKVLKKKAKIATAEASEALAKLSEKIKQ